MNKLLITIAATVFVATTAFGVAAESASTPIKIESHATKVAPAKHSKLHASAASTVQKSQAKKHATSAASTVQKAQAKKHAASAASAVHKKSGNASASSVI